MIFILYRKRTCCHIMIAIFNHQSMIGRIWMSATCSIIHAITTSRISSGGWIPRYALTCNCLLYHKSKVFLYVGTIRYVVQVRIKWFYCTINPSLKMSNAIQVLTAVDLIGQEIIRKTESSKYVFSIKYDIKESRPDADLPQQRNHLVHTKTHHNDKTC
jgi:hypothetical protein